MKVKDFINKGSLITLSATLLFTPVSSVLANEYQLNNSVQVYDKAESAKNREESKKTYPKGKYFIFKQESGMINITRVEGQPGGWINPNDNISGGLKEVKVQESTPVEENLEFVVNTQVNGYIDSDSARADLNPVTIVSPGKYYIYRTHNGMINITKIKGVPGSWIDPTKNTPSSNNKNTTITTETEESNSKFVLNESVAGYYDSYSAKDQIDTPFIVEKGEYHVFSRYNGMINITKDEGEPGYWINPTGIKQEVKFEENSNVYIQTKDLVLKPLLVELDEERNVTKLTLDKEIKSEINLENDTEGYLSASEAKEQNNPINIVYKGKYFVYKALEGMLNVSKSTNSPGAWINPSAGKLVEVVSVLEDKKVLASSDQDSTPLSEIEETAESQQDNETLLQETDTVEIVDDSEKETENTDVQNADVQNADVGVSEDVPTNEISSEAQNIESEKESNLENSENSLFKVDAEVKEFTIGQEYELKEATQGYQRSSDALIGENPVETLEPGKYVIRKAENGLLNITKELGLPGYWIIPQ